MHYLAIKPGGLYIDATFGGGGHTQGILAQGGKVLGLDQDRDAIEAFEPALASTDLTLVHTNFTNITSVARLHNWTPISGVLFDLGVSSHHLDTPERGFSFQSSGPLDMRMDQSLPMSAKDLVNTLPVDQLAHIFRVYGDIVSASQLALKVVAVRPLETTTQLANITERFTRQAFQALRIATNDELTAIEVALPQAYDLLIPNGRLVVISFHSLEDRLVKDFFKHCGGQILTDKPITADAVELAENLRAKSAKLRAIQKIWKKYISSY